MNNKLNNQNDSNPINNLVESKNFINLSQEVQTKVLKSIGDNTGKEGGFLGKFLGNKISNAALHIALIICILLLIIVIIDMFHSYIVNCDINIELITIILPVITLSLGYIFGAGKDN